ncbi:hypothetical protein [Streptomyces sp. NRRL S-340]|uniref:hypothetical protein n=1 Tax=Streptomyces sp. NRRL S-340 TaxID=1463901 RepID=UPI00056C76A1|nr:hypothetical protein [Streptomyces sp. NRRL S-340]
MLAHTMEKPAVQPAESGWARARRLRDRHVRTCLPAVEDRGGTQRERGRGDGGEWNIVRGED